MVLKASRSPSHHNTLKLQRARADANENLTETFTYDTLNRLASPTVSRISRR